MQLVATTVASMCNSRYDLNGKEFFQYFYPSFHIMKETCIVFQVMEFNIGKGDMKHCMCDGNLFSTLLLCIEGERVMNSG